MGLGMGLGGSTYGVPFVSKFMYFPWYHTMNSIIIPSILYNYIMHSIIHCMITGKYMNSDTNGTL